MLILLALLAQDGNRFAYLDEADPYYVSRTFPKLTTPQWVGEEGVDAVVVLAIDDMRGHERWEAYLRPVLERLKKIDGRAPVSIMTCKIDPREEHLQKWLREGVSLEVHTIDHPCPLLKDGDFAKAKSTFDRCIDQMASIPFSTPVAYRMPCCDSLNTPSPRFFAEIFNATTESGRFLQIDTSVFNITTPADPDLPRNLVLDPDGKPRFRKYLPFPSFVNTIEDYPYPYVIGRLCWEFPCIVPSDWEAQNIHKPANPVSIADMKAALDAVVIKKGVYDLVFHPYGWMTSAQVVEIIDHAVAKHGNRVKFLTFRECLERLNANLLAGRPLRDGKGRDHGVRLMDLDRDGFLDVVLPGKTRLWSGTAWEDLPFPVTGMASARFGVVETVPCVISESGGWAFRDGGWNPLPALTRGLPAGAWLRDIDGDGECEALHGADVYSWDDGWKKSNHALPAPVDDPALRFVDLDGDGRDDVVVSDEKGWSVHVWKDGFRRVASGEAGGIPLISRNGTNNGAWFHTGHMWVQNEDTAKLKDLVDRRTFKQLLEGRP